MSIRSSKRAEQILVELLQRGEVNVETLAERHDVTPTTIRRDLADMERRGLLRRTHGGAMPVEPMLYEPFRNDVYFQEQEQRYAVEKRLIGLAAAQLVADGDTIAISAGTTATQVARSLRHRKNITIITNAVNIAMELSNQSDLSVQMTGGVLRGSWFSLVGAKAAQSLSDMYVDWAFIGADGVHAERGITSHYPEESVVNQAMLNHARHRVVVAHSEKIGRFANALISPLDNVDIFITDATASENAIQPFVAQQVAVKRV